MPKGRGSGPKPWPPLVQPVGCRQEVLGPEQATQADAPSLGLRPKPIAIPQTLLTGGGVTLLGTLQTRVGGVWGNRGEDLILG